MIDRNFEDSKHFSKTPNVSAEQCKEQFTLSKPLAYSRFRLVDNFPLMCILEVLQNIRKKIITPVEPTLNNLH